MEPRSSLLLPKNNPKSHNLWGEEKLMCIPKVLLGDQPTLGEKVVPREERRGSPKGKGKPWKVLTK